MNSNKSTNDELKQLYRELEISEAIRFKRLQWAGHVIRMEEHGIPKKSYAGSLEEEGPSEGQQVDGRMQCELMWTVS
jgi:hypothetical protein